MKINYEKSFLKDIKKLKNKKIAIKLKNILENLEKEDDITNIKNIKKLKGYKNFYRLKIDDYRLGFSFDNNQIDIIRFLHRKEIYKFFP